MNTNFLEPGDPRRLSLHAPFGAGDAFCPECDMPWPCDVELQRQVLADEHAKLMVAIRSTLGLLNEMHPHVAEPGPCTMRTDFCSVRGMLSAIAPDMAEASVYPAAPALIEVQP